MTDKTIAKAIVAIVRQMTRLRTPLSWQRLIARRDHDAVHVALHVLTTQGIIHTNPDGDYALADELAGLWPTTQMARRWIEQARSDER